MHAESRAETITAAPAGRSFRRTGRQRGRGGCAGAGRGGGGRRRSHTRPPHARSTATARGAIGLRGVRRASGARARAVLGRVAVAGRGAALERRGPERVGRTVVAHTVTGRRQIAVTLRGAATGRALRVHGARGTCPGAVLGSVAGTCRRAAAGGRGDEDVAWAGYTRPSTLLLGVADI